MAVLILLTIESRILCHACPFLMATIAAIPAQMINAIWFGP
jgi:hypothetical protein